MTGYEWTAVIFCIIFLGLFIWHKYEQNRRRKIQRYINGCNAVNYTRRQKGFPQSWRR